MNTPNLIHFLSQWNLLGEARKASVSLRKVLIDCLNADHEELLIVSDFGSPGKRISAILAGGYLLAARSLGMIPNVLMQPQKNKGDQAEMHIEEALYDMPSKNIIVMAVNSLGKTPQIGKSFRRFARGRKHKFISSTGLGSLKSSQIPFLMRAIDVDYKDLRKRGNALKDILDRGQELRITTPAGTDLWLGIRGKKAISNDGSYFIPGSGGNMPAGEVYMPPRKKKAEGTVVVDGSSRSIKGTLLTKNPITITVEDGDVTHIEGGNAARKLEESIQWALDRGKFTWGVRRLSEFGLGINPNAKIIGAMILDEKAPNTAHVALGSNYWFGGTVYSIIHLDHVMKNPTIAVDGKPIPKKLYT